MPVGVCREDNCLAAFFLTSPISAWYSLICLAASLICRSEKQLLAEEEALGVSKLIQHEVTIEVHGEKIVGHYNLERCGRWDRLTVWYHGRSLVDDEIAHEADPWSTESVAEQLLQQLATSEVKDG